jgi:peptide/nickel transport system permease protein
MTVVTSSSRKRRFVRTLRRLTRKVPSLIGLVIVVIFYGWSLVEGILQLIAKYLFYPPYITPQLAWALLPYDPFEPSFQSTLSSPSLMHLMGTDELGRDIFSRVLYAAPTDAAISIVVVLFGVLIGGLLGLPAGYFGKGVEEVNMRFTDLFLAFPALILALVIEATLGRAVVFAIVALIVVWWPSYARLFRGEMLRIKNHKFIDAALLSGLSDTAIITRHALRASLNTILSYSTIDLGNVILVYSILSFLGLGAPPPYPEWGSMVSSGLGYLQEAWWYSFLPGAVITAIVIGFALLGDGIRDVLAGEQ